MSILKFIIVYIFLFYFQFCYSEEPRKGLVAFSIPTVQLESSEVVGILPQEDVSKSPIWGYRLHFAILSGSQINVIRNYIEQPPAVQYHSITHKKLSQLKAGIDLGVHERIDFQLKAHTSYMVSAGFKVQVLGKSFHHLAEKSFSLAYYLDLGLLPFVTSHDQTYPTALYKINSVNSLSHGAVFGYRPNRLWLINFGIVQSAFWATVDVTQPITDADYFKYHHEARARAYVYSLPLSIERDLDISNKKQIMYTRLEIAGNSSVFYESKLNSIDLGLQVGWRF